MRYKIIVTVFMFFTLFFIGCGIEDTTYIKEIENLNVYNNRTTNVRLRFSGFNQEEGVDGKYLFVGYDIYYYFTSRADAKKANVYMPLKDKESPSRVFDPVYPLIKSNNKLIYFPNDDDNKARFPVASFPRSMLDFYRTTTFPVTEDMIKKILEQSRNDNVQFGFELAGVNGLRDATSDSDDSANPYIDSTGSYIYLGGIFPDYSEYSDKDWGVKQTQEQIDDGNPFLGFYDRDYYDNHSPKIEPIEGNPNLPSGTVKYRVYFYVIAKGFNSSFERNQNYILSDPSNIVEVIFEVYNNTRKQN